MSSFYKWGNWGQEKLNHLLCSDSIKAGNNLSSAEIILLLCLLVRVSLSFIQLAEENLEQNSPSDISNLHPPSTSQGIRHVHPKQNKGVLFRAPVGSGRVGFESHLLAGSWLQASHWMFLNFIFVKQMIITTSFIVWLVGEGNVCKAFGPMLNTVMFNQWQILLWLFTLYFSTVCGGLMQKFKPYCDWYVSNKPTSLPCPLFNTVQLIKHQSRACYAGPFPLQLVTMGGLWWGDLASSTIVYASYCPISCFCSRLWWGQQASMTWKKPGHRNAWAPWTSWRKDFVFCLWKLIKHCYSEF